MIQSPKILSNLATGRLTSQAIYYASIRLYTGYSCRIRQEPQSRQSKSFQWGHLPVNVHHYTSPRSSPRQSKSSRKCDKLIIRHQKEQHSLGLPMSNQKKCVLSCEATTNVFAIQWKKSEIQSNFFIKTQTMTSVEGIKDFMKVWWHIVCSKYENVHFYWIQQSHIPVVLRILHLPELRILIINNIFTWKNWN